MAETSYFKKYKRDTRILTTEENFKLGECFTRAPLSIGKARLLVNYDINDEGESLSPRNGYVTTEVDSFFEGTLVSDLENVNISAYKECIEEDGMRYRLVIADEIPESESRVEGTDLYTSEREMWVTHDDSNVIDDSLVSLNEYNIVSKNMYALPMNYDMTETYQAVPKCYYHVPRNIDIHGMHVTDKRMFAKPVGTFAFMDNDYYCFNTAGEIMRSRYDADYNTYITEALSPKKLTPSEAAQCGYNILDPNPTEFTDNLITGLIVFTGCLCYTNDSSAKPVTEPLMNTKYTLRFFYEGQENESYFLRYYIQDTKTNTVTELGSQSFTVGSSLPQLKFTNFSSTLDNAILIIKAFEDDEAEEYKAIGMFNMYFQNINSENLLKLSIENYTLTKSSDIVSWQDRLWVYGVPECKTILFSSAKNEPTFFPYPNNVIAFDSEVLKCVPFNDWLLIFTKTNIYRFTIKADGTRVTEVIQSNLSFDDFDVTFIQVVKNMVFFRSGNYYYMIVKKTLSLNDEFVLAPISKNIENFLDNFEDNVRSLFTLMYDYENTIDIVANYNYVNYEDVHNIYSFDLNGKFVNLDLLYNTVERTWRTYVYESSDIYQPVAMDATKQCRLYSTIYLRINGTTRPGIQYFETSNNIIPDFYIPNNSRITKANGVWRPDNGVIKANFENIHIFKNFQMLDCGYRDNALDYNKRYRELQFKFNNVSGTNLRFITEFIIDGETRVNKYKYETEQVIDPSDPKYGYISITRVPIMNIEVPSTSVLAETLEQTNYWVLDLSPFPEVAFWKARLKVSGKGYTPRFRLICRSEERYELLGYSWVYRLMNAR